MTSVLTEDLTKRYRRKTALNDRTLEPPEGRVIGLVGPNGSGETTLLNLAARLLSPTSGSLTVLGEALAVWRVRRR